MNSPTTSVFISYRRDGGADVARLLQAFLESHSIRVFLDVDNLDAGHFDNQLLTRIEQHDCFLMVCSPKALDRCQQADDWVRREITHAIACRRRIIPVTLAGFQWPAREQLPADIAEFAKYQAFEYQAAYWKATSGRLLSMVTELPAARQVPAPSGGTEENSWSSACLRLLRDIQRAVEERDHADMLESGGPDGDLDSDEYDVLDDPHSEVPWLKLPLEVDTRADCEPCRSLLQSGQKLDQFLEPFATRLRAGMELIRKIPTATEPRLSRALLEVHLLNIVSVIRLYAERGEAPDPTVERVVARAAGCVAAAEGGHSRQSAELHHLLMIATRCLEMEIHLIANPPSTTEVDQAMRRGHLAYGSDWRDRLEQFVAHHASAFQWSASATFHSPESCNEKMPALWDFHRMAAQSRWLAVAAECLMDPTAPLSAAISRHPKPSDTRLSNLDSEPFLVARGAWRVAELLTHHQISHDDEAALDALTDLLEDCLEPISLASTRGQAWSAIPPCPSLEALFALCCRARGPSERCVRADLLAALFFTMSRTSAPGKLADDLRRASSLCFLSCRSSGQIGRKYWRPGTQCRSHSVRTLLWVYLFCIGDDDHPCARDAVLLALATDPGASALQDAVSLYERAFGRECLNFDLEDAVELLRTPASTLRGKVPAPIVTATIPNADRLVEHISELIHPSDGEIPF